MTIRQGLVEELLAGRDPSEVFTRDGLLDELKRALAERMLDAELGQHLSSERARADGVCNGAVAGPRSAPGFRQEDQQMHKVSAGTPAPKGLPRPSRSTAGLVAIEKGYERNRPQTVCRITGEGRRRLLDYLAVLEQVVRDAAEARKPPAPAAHPLTPKPA